MQGAETKKLIMDDSLNLHNPAEDTLFAGFSLVEKLDL